MRAALQLVAVARAHKAAVYEYPRPTMIILFPSIAYLIFPDHSNPTAVSGAGQFAS
jgi:hypothetical protein